MFAEYKSAGFSSVQQPSHPSDIGEAADETDIGEVLSELGAVTAHGVSDEHANPQP